MRYDVAVIGGGPSGAIAAAVLATAGISTVLIERNLENIKPCGGAIPLGLIEEFQIPDELIEKKLSSMRARSPKGRVKKDMAGTCKRMEQVVCLGSGNTLYTGKMVCLLCCR